MVTRSVVNERLETECHQHRVVSAMDQSSEGVCMFTSKSAGWTCVHNTLKSAMYDEVIIGLRQPPYSSARFWKNEVGDSQSGNCSEKMPPSSSQYNSQATFVTLLRLPSVPMCGRRCLRYVSSSFCINSGSWDQALEPGTPEIASMGMRDFWRQYIKIYCIFRGQLHPRREDDSVPLHAR